MLLTGKVVQIESGQAFTDKTQRVKIVIDNPALSAYADSLYVLNTDGLVLDQTVTIDITGRSRNVTEP